MDNCNSIINKIYLKKLIWCYLLDIYKCISLSLVGIHTSNFFLRRNLAVHYMVSQFDQKILVEKPYNLLEIVWLKVNQWFKQWHCSGKENLKSKASHPQIWKNNYRNVSEVGLQKKGEKKMVMKCVEKRILHSILYNILRG